jgi:hypothetical protein
MFSSLGQNSIIYLLDLKAKNKILACPIEKVTLPVPKYASYGQNVEMIVDIIANVNGERREFKGVPNTSIADFGKDAFILAENKESLNSYINAKIQNYESFVNSYEENIKQLALYKEAQEELNPEIKANAEKDKAIQEDTRIISPSKHGT